MPNFKWNTKKKQVRIREGFEVFPGGEEEPIDVNVVVNYETGEIEIDETIETITNEFCNDFADWAVRSTKQNIPQPVFKTLCTTVVGEIIDFVEAFLYQEQAARNRLDKMDNITFRNALSYLKQFPNGAVDRIDSPPVGSKGYYTHRTISENRKNIAIQPLDIPFDQTVTITLDNVFVDATFTAVEIAAIWLYANDARNERNPNIRSKIPSEAQNVHNRARVENGVFKLIASGENSGREINLANDPDTNNYAFDVFLPTGKYYFMCATSDKEPRFSSITTSIHYKDFVPVEKRINIPLVLGGGAATIFLLYLLSKRAS